MAVKESVVLWCAVLLSWCSAQEWSGPRCAREQPCRQISFREIEDGHTREKVNIYEYQVRDSQLKIKYTMKSDRIFDFEFTCKFDITFDDPALPAFPDLVDVHRVRLQACSSPSFSYKHALQALNISLSYELQLFSQTASLGAEHLDNLQIKSFTLESAKDVTAPLVLDVTATSIRYVKLNGTLDWVKLGANVTELTVVQLLGMELRGDCSALEQVTLVNTTQPVPAHWLAHCPSVQVLYLEGPSCPMVGHELPNARNLRYLSVDSCSLRELPASWIENLSELKTLDLSNNLLELLPSLKALKKLEVLRAYNNRLQSAALQPWASLPKTLAKLHLSFNPGLGDLCEYDNITDASGLSPLRNLRALNYLHSQNTSLTRICRDWRLNLTRLQFLDLSNNNITSLSREDLQWRRDLHSVVYLSNNNVRVKYTEDDYHAALSQNIDQQEPATTIVLDNLTPCDCHDYWLARASREAPCHLPIMQRLRCRLDAVDATAVAVPRDLDEVPLDKFICNMTEGCPKGCLCRPLPGAAELRCERAGLSIVPHLSAGLADVRTLLLAGNNITHLRATDVPPTLRLLDLRDNGLRTLDALAVAALWDTHNRSVLLSGNPLDCSCAALPLLSVLAADPARVRDSSVAHCMDGRTLKTAAKSSIVDCTTSPSLQPSSTASAKPETQPLLQTLWVVLFSAFAPVILLTLACLLYPATRYRLKRVLFERGLCTRWMLRRERAEAIKDCEFDAFVSFSHHDRCFVDELVHRLESGTSARRLCLHERDWVPGEWISQQIVRSVHSSQRTLVLLSENFLQSQWARAELREAYAAALTDLCPRLLLVLLPGFSAERAARAEVVLAEYISRVTCLYWEDPHFWHKLELMLPPARGVTTRALKNALRSPPPLP